MALVVASTSTSSSVWDLLGRDELEHIVNATRSDTRGNITIPGIAAACGLRGVCKATAAMHKDTPTPYDAEVLYNTRWPVGFRGGLGFSDADKPSMRFFIVYDPIKGRAFACTTKEGERIDGWKEVKRLWPLPRLARLVNGHCADLNRRLIDLDAVASGDILFVKKGELSHSTGVVPPPWYPQIVTESREPFAHATVAKHDHDYVAHKVTLIPDTKGKYVKTPSFVIASAFDYRNGHTVLELAPEYTSKCGKEKKVFNNHVASDPDDATPPIHFLSIALGWFDYGWVVQRWCMVSIYCHGKKRGETCYKGPMRERRRLTMSNLALKRSDKQASRHWNDLPTGSRSGRKPRGAALRAKEMIINHTRNDNATNNSGRLQSILQSPTRRREEQMQDEVDDEYARPGERAPIRYDSDEEFDPKIKGKKRSRAERLAINCAREMEEERRLRAELLAPSDCDDDEY